MGGWACRTVDCKRCTYRRPPLNFCKKCRPCNRGNHLKARSDASKKDSTTSKAKTKPSVEAGHTVPEAASHLAGTATERLDEPSSRAAAHMAVETLGMPSAPAGTVSSSSAASPLDFAAWHSLLEAQLPRLSLSVGLGNAHCVLSVAHSIIDKFASIKRALPPHVEALLSVAIALSPFSNNDVLVVKWLKAIGWTGRKMAPFQAQWIMALPFNSELEQPSLHQIATLT